MDDALPRHSSTGLARAPWMTDFGVRMLVSTRAAARWCGDDDIPEEERALLEKHTGYWNRSHFGSAHDWVRESGVETLPFRDEFALIFGYESRRSAWLPSATGGTVVQVTTDYCDRAMADRAEVYAPVLAGAAEAHYTREADLLFGVIDPEHVLMPACQPGTERDLPETRQTLTLRRGLYEVWSARMKFRLGAIGIYYQLRHLPHPVASLG